MVGREEEIKLFNENYTSERSEFIAVFGRCRVGKTFLIRSFFQDKYTFHLTGIANATLEEQLDNFNTAFNAQHPKLSTVSETWLEAFEQIKKCIAKSRQKKKVIFIDELPWFDTPKSNFIRALEHFWNSWASARTDIVLIVCGSAASWMINKLINNRGGLHNRVTQRMRIEPFTLQECKEYSKSRKMNLDHYHIIQLYMVLGGIPFYWDEVEKGLSATQNVNKICFSKNGLLRTEFQNIFKSLFNKAEKHELIVATLAKKTKGFTRKEIIEDSKISDGGGLSTILNELEESGFIRKYIPFNKKSRDSLYQLIDFYSLFYINFIQNHQLTEKDFWLKAIDNPKHRAWSGYAYEQVCLYHLDQIKKGLGISGIITNTSSWRSKSSENAAQVDLVIDRRDQVVNLCEMKFSINKFEIDKKYDEVLREKIGVFKSETKTRKSVFMTMITTFGLQNNRFSGNVQNELTMDVLFE